jgi:hypothetical protein
LRRYNKTTIAWAAIEFDDDVWATAGWCKLKPVGTCGESTLFQ